MTFKEKALSLVSEDKIEDALEVISSYLQDSKKTDLWNEITMLKGRYAESKKQKRLDTIDLSDFIKSRNSLRFSILNLLDTITKEKMNGSINDIEKINIFISYSNQDIKFKEKLDSYLSILTNGDKINTWSESEINEGELYEHTSEKIEESDIAILLISPDYIDSDFFWNQIEYFTERHENGTITMIPVVVRPCIWKRLLKGDIKILPHNGVPLNKHENLELAYSQIIKELKEAINQHSEYRAAIKPKITEHEAQIRNGLSYENINNLEALIELYKRINNQKKVKKYQQDLTQLKFEYNIANPIKIKEFHIENVSVFNEIHWELQPGINILLGRNGFGKSHLIRLIPCMLRNEKSIMDKDYHLKTFSDLRVIIAQNDEDKKTHYNNCEFLEDIGNIPMLAIPAIRNLNTNGSLTPASDEIDGELKHIGAVHLIRQYPFNRLIQNHLYIFANNLIKESLKHEENIEQTLNNSFSVKLIAKIIQELTRDESFTIQTIKEYYGQARIDFKVTTEGNPEPVSLQKVSLGTISVLSIVLLIYHYLKSLYPELEDKKLVRQKAVVLIDEIDAHMHPIWQRKIVNILRNSFPNVQFILTAHSPLVVAGCLEREVVVLRKEGKSGKFSLHQFEQNFIGKEIEDIYRIVFEIEDVDEDEMYKSLLFKRSRWSPEEIDKKINELEQKENLTDEEENELNELFLLSRIKYIREEKESRNLEEVVEKLRAENRQLKYELELKN